MAALVIALVLLAPPAVALAQSSAPSSLPPDIQTSEFFQALLYSLNGTKGATSLVLVALGTQVVMAFLRSPLAHWAGKWRLTAVALLSVVGGVIALRVQGVDWLTALLHSTTLASAQVFVHQAILQFNEPKDPKLPVPS